MSSLKAQIDWSERVARFSGPGTFAAKDDIKRLGGARWNGNEKVWEVRPFTLSVDELSARFPDIVVEEQGSNHAIQAEQAELKQLEQSLDIDNSLSVSQFLATVEAAITRAFPANIFVRGIISKLTERQGSLFIELHDEHSPDRSIDCVVWSRNAARVRSKLEGAGFELELDLNVMFEARAAANPKNGRISLNVSNIVPEYTIGKLAREREITNKRLKEEGIFENNARLKLSILPQRLGILTSQAGTVINDFRAALEQSQFGFKLFWYPVRVQGREAKDDIVEGIRVLSALPEIDAILLFRGGGSISDLAVFNDYHIARAICLAPIPVLSAIGHQADQSSTQDVSCKAFGVPKDVGHFFAEIISDLRERQKNAVRVLYEKVATTLAQKAQLLDMLTSSIRQQLTQTVRYHRDTVENISRTLLPLSLTVISRWSERLLALARPLPALSQSLASTHFVRLKHLLERIIRQSERQLSEKRILLKGLEELISSAQPERQLERGYVLVERAGSEGFVTRASQLIKGQRVDLKFADDKRNVEVRD